ncbi:MAG: hypothetical protein AAF206_27800, partial [Bacteroidota bacterium]
HGIRIDHHEKARRYLLLSLLQSRGLKVSDFRKRFDQNRVNQMRDDLYDDHGWKDAGIIRHWARVHENIKNGDLLMVRLPKAIAERLGKKVQPLIDEGEIPSKGHYVARVLKDKLSGGLFS